MKQGGNSWLSLRHPWHFPRSQEVRGSTLTSCLLLHSSFMTVSIIRNTTFQFQQSNRLLIWRWVFRCWRCVCLFVCLDDLPVKGTLHTPTRGYKCQAGNSQSLSCKHWFNVCDYELHKSRCYASVTRRILLHFDCFTVRQLILRLILFWRSCKHFWLLKEAFS